ncbi:hypothetical protein LCGC14_1096370, partial [marine sediment metagenome]
MKKALLVLFFVFFLAVPARGDGVYSEAATVLTTSAVSPMT